MVSVAESSVASVPLQDLSALQTRLLGARSAGRQADGIDDAQLTQSSLHAGTTAGDAPGRAEAAIANDIAVPETETGTHTTRQDESGDGEAAIAESVDSAEPHAPPARPTSAKGRMEAVAAWSPSQEALRAMMRAETFHGFPGGDTQPMDSQVYRKYRESTTRRKLATATPAPAIEDETDAAVNPTPHTYQEGESGFVDLEGAWRQHDSPGGQTQTSGIDELLASPQTQFQMPELPYSVTMPETPALAGHKRRHSGEVLSSDAATTRKTPRYSQLFGAPAAPAPILSATQLFGQTQAPSSPGPDAPRSDPVLTRPSPDMRVRTSLSSPPAMRTSPVVAVHHAPGDPRDTYTSMRESDERRWLREEAELHVLDEDDDFDMLDTQPRHYGGVRRVTSDQALRPTKQHPALIDLVTPATVRRREGKVEFEFDDVSDDEAPMIEEEDIDAASLQNDQENDQYDELGQEVMRSQPNEYEDEAQSDDGDNADHDNEEGDERAVPSADDTGSRFALPDNAPEKAVSATQPSAVPDSQGQQTSCQHTQPTFCQPPTMSSFVPGSQYAGKTSQEQALLARRSVPRSTAEAPSSKDIDGVPSSPPVPPASNTVPENTAEASLARQRTLAQIQNCDVPSKTADTDREVPEGDVPVPNASRRPNTARSLPIVGSNHSVPNPFSTAPTHISSSNQSPRKPGVIKSNSQASADTPRKRLGIRHFDSINNDSSQAAILGGEEELDIEGLMGEVMTAEDRAFIAAMGSFGCERDRDRARGSGDAAQDVVAEAEATVAEAAEEARAGNVSAVPSSASSEQPRKRRPLDRTAGPARAVMEDVATSQPEVGETIVASVEGLPPAAGDEARILRSSPSKANELPVSTPENAGPPKGTQDGTRKREKAGAEAVSQLLGMRKARALQTYVRSRRMVVDEEEEARLVKKGAKKVKGPRLSLKGTRKTAAAEAKVVQPAVVVEDDHVAVADDPAVPSETTAADDAPEADELPITAPNRILALFKGSPSNFYPADFLACLSNGKRYRIAFADTPPVTIDAQHVRALDLRIGSQVKVDGREMRSKTWIVEGFGPVQEGAPGTDMYGHATVHVRAKGNRRSLADGQTDEKKLVEVPVNQIYITPSMWPAFGSRKFLPPAPGAAVSGRLHTPSPGLQTPGAATPGSRTRRSAISSVNLRASISGLRGEALAPRQLSADPSGIFAGMAFAISYSSEEADKAEVTSLLRAHGGTILESGFDELFDVPGLHDSTAEDAEAGHPGLRLRPEYADLGFVALIADRHSRRAKYMQALALGLPAVSGRWVRDSLASASDAAAAAAGRGNKAVRPWERYLLAAGESAYLNGAVRSRMLAPHDAAVARLRDTIAKRARLLQGEGALIVAGAGKKGRGAWERRKAYAFLTLALGAGAVRRVPDLAGAREVVRAEGKGRRWKWVYVDGSVTEAAAALDAETEGQQRRRGEGGGGAGGSGGGKHQGGKVMSTEAMGGRVRVVNDEFVVQSLIFGGLVE